MSTPCLYMHSWKQYGRLHPCCVFVCDQAGSHGPSWESQRVAFLVTVTWNAKSEPCIAGYISQVKQHSRKVSVSFCVSAELSRGGQKSTSATSGGGGDAAC